MLVKEMKKYVTHSYTNKKHSLSALFQMLLKKLSHKRETVLQRLQNNNRFFCEYLWIFLVRLYSFIPVIKLNNQFIT